MAVSRLRSLGLLKKSNLSKAIVLSMIFSRVLTGRRELSVPPGSPCLPLSGRYPPSTILKGESQPHVHPSLLKLVAPSRQVYALPSTDCVQVPRYTRHNSLSTTPSACIAPSPACQAKRTPPPPSHADSSSPVHMPRSHCASSPSGTRVDTSSEPRIVSSVPAADIRF